MSARSMHKDMMARGAHCALMAVRCFFALALIGGAFAIILGLMPVCVVGSTNGALGECTLGAGIAWADDEQIDVDRQCSLTLLFPQTTPATDGIPFYAVKVADVNPDGTYSNYASWFTSYSGYLKNTDNWNAVAYYAKNDLPDTDESQLEAKIEVVDRTTYTVDFGSDLSTGLYLVYANTYEYEMFGIHFATYEYSPMLVQLPSNVGMADEPDWLYDVTCYIKPLGEVPTIDGSAGGGYGGDSTGEGTSAGDSTGGGYGGDSTGGGASAGGSTGGASAGGSTGGGSTGGGSKWSFPDIDWTSSISFDFPEDLIEEIINGSGAGNGTSSGSGGKYTSSIIIGNKNSSSVSSMRNAKISLVTAGGSSQSRDVTGATEDRLPQTGLLVWPVVVLVVTGLWLICLGVIRHKKWAAREAQTCDPELGGGVLD